MNGNLALRTTLIPEGIYAIFYARARLETFINCASIDFQTERVAKMKILILSSSEAGEQCETPSE